MYDWISQSVNVDALRRQGEEPWDRAKEYLVKSPDYHVIYGGEEVASLAVPVTLGGLHSFCSADYTEGREVAIQVFGREVEEVAISPKRLSVPCRIQGDMVYFIPPKPGHYVIQMNRSMESPLTISLQPEREKPGGITKYFGPGLHQMDYMDMEDGDVIFLEAGALIQAKTPPKEEAPVLECDWAGRRCYRSFWEARQKKKIHICGAGIIDLSGLDWHERSHLLLSECEDILIEGITFIGAPAWTVHLNACRNAKIRDLRLYGHRENSDGIDICSCEEIEVSDCFIRTGDDAICVKGLRQPPVPGGKNIDVHGCVIWNDKVRCLGITCETRNDITHVAFLHCDIVHSIPTWTREIGSLCVIVCDHGAISDVRFEDIWIEQEAKYAVNCMIMKDKWSTQKEAGYIRGVIFRNIHAPSGTYLNFMGYDEGHIVEDILLDQYWIGDRRLEEKGEWLEQNEFTKNIMIGR